MARRRFDYIMCVEGGKVEARRAGKRGKMRMQRKEASEREREENNKNARVGRKKTTHGNM